MATRPSIKVDDGWIHEGFMATAPPFIRTPNKEQRAKISTSNTIVALAEHQINTGKTTMDAMKSFVSKAAETAGSLVSPTQTQSDSPEAMNFNNKPSGSPSSAEQEGGEGNEDGSKFCALASYGSPDPDSSGDKKEPPPPEMTQLPPTSIFTITSLDLDEENSGVAVDADRAEPTEIDRPPSHGPNKNQDVVLADQERNSTNEEVTVLGTEGGMKMRKSTELKSRASRQARGEIQGNPAKQPSDPDESGGSGGSDESDAPVGSDDTGSGDDFDPQDPESKKKRGKKKKVSKKQGAKTTDGVIIDEKSPAEDSFEAIREVLSSDWDRLAKVVASTKHDIEPVLSYIKAQLVDTSVYNEAPFTIGHFINLVKSKQSHEEVLECCRSKSWKPKQSKRGPSTNQEAEEKPHARSTKRPRKGKHSATISEDDKKVSQKKTKHCNNYSYGEPYVLPKGKAKADVAWEAWGLVYPTSLHNENLSQWKMITDALGAKNLKKRLCPSGVSLPAELENLRDPCSSQLPTSITLAPSQVVKSGHSDHAAIASGRMTKNVLCGTNKKDWVPRHHLEGINCVPALQVNDVVFINGHDIHLVNDWIYFVGAYKMSEGLWTCKVGYLKCLPGYLAQVINRCAMVTQLKPSGKNGEVGGNLVKTVNGMAYISFLDYGPVHKQSHMVRDGRNTSIGFRSAKKSADEHDNFCPGMYLPKPNAQD